MSKVLCYNRGCGQEFDPNLNNSDSCSFHPGTPFFHETYKGWTCCNKKSTDFTEFLNIKGCAKDRHSNIKPKEEVVSKITVPEPVVSTPAPMAPPKERPSHDVPLVPLPRTVNASLTKQLEELKDNVIAVDNEDDVKEVNPETSCFNAGCKATYGDKNASVCLYHEGVPVFHEGMKFWSCCQRKTSDFDAFLDQVGCVEGKHIWKKPKVSSENVDKSKTCRMDWFQTEEDVTISVYSKIPWPALSLVEGNAVKLSMNIIFGHDRKEYANQIILGGVIDLEKSKVSFMSSKVEIVLKKADPVCWTKLALPAESND